MKNTYNYIKELYYLRRYIVFQTVVQSILLGAMVSIVNRRMWVNLFSNTGGWIWDNIANIIFCTVLVIGIFSYTNSNLRYKLIVDNRYEIENEYLYYKSIFYGTALLIAFYVGSSVYEYFTGDTVRVLGLIFVAVFLAMPIFWLKTLFYFYKSILGFILSFAVTYSTYKEIEEEDRKGKLTALGLYTHLQLLQITNEAIAPEMNLGITEQDTKSFTDDIVKAVNTNGNTDEYVRRVQEANEKMETKAILIRLALFGFYVLSMLYYSVTTTWAFHKYEGNADSMSLAEPVKSHDWIDIYTNGTVAYDENTVSLDRKNGVTYFLCRFKHNNEWKHFWFYFKYPEGSGYLIDATENGMISETGENESKNKFTLTRDIVNPIYAYFEKKLEFIEAKPTKIKFDLEDYHQLKLNGDSVEEIGEKSIPILVLAEGTGETKNLAIGSYAAVKAEGTIKCYTGAGLTFAKDVTVPQGLKLAKRISLIQNRRTLDYGAQARLTRRLSFSEKIGKDGKKKKYTFEKGTLTTVDSKMTDGTYRCHLIVGDESYGAFLKEEDIVPIQKHNWYLVGVPVGDSQEIYWVEGKDLVPVKDKRKDTKKEQ